MVRKVLFTAGLSTAAFRLAANVALAQPHTRRPFTGAKVNAGTVTHSVKNAKHVLTLSDDFLAPDPPDPHWQVVDSRGNGVLLQRLGVKSLGGIAKDRINMSITLPDTIRDIAKVQIHCAWADAILGETALPVPTTTSC